MDRAHSSEKPASQGVTGQGLYADGMEHPSAREHAHRNGAIAYFRKPVDGSALIDCIRFAQRLNG